MLLVDVVDVDDNKDFYDDVASAVAAAGLRVLPFTASCFFMFALWLRVMCVT